MSGAERAKWVDTKHSDTFHLNSGEGQKQHRDQVRAERGDDWIVILTDDLRNVVRCGRGNATVMYSGHREHKDHESCEHVIPYSP